VYVGNAENPEEGLRVVGSIDFCQEIEGYRLLLRGVNQLLHNGWEGHYRKGEVVVGSDALRPAGPGREIVHAVMFDHVVGLLVGLRGCFQITLSEKRPSALRKEDMEEEHLVEAGVVAGTRRSDRTFDASDKGRVFEANDRHLIERTVECAESSQEILHAMVRISREDMDQDVEPMYASLCNALRVLDVSEVLSGHDSNARHKLHGAKLQKKLQQVLGRDKEDLALWH
jgi:hypothetical protein